MEDLSHDFDVLAERADDCGALWAVRTMRRMVAGGAAPPHVWPGTIDEARRVVETFADRVGFAERENLASIVQYTAEWTWSESFDDVRSMGAAALPGPAHHAPSVTWRLDKLSVP
jgi:hypothetical protein